MEGVFRTIADTLPHPGPLPEGEGEESASKPSPSGRGSGEGNNNAFYHKLFPADLRPQAHEIIRTWAFYTIVKAHLHSNTIPWKNVMISGWCLASDKTKMSKSKGNVITPVDLIRDKGADAVRYWASTSRLGSDTAFSEDLLKIGKKLVTKLWNATTFAAIHLGKITNAPTTAAGDVASGKISEALDLWILSRLQKTVDKATQEFERFEYSDARVAIEEFFWKDFCDNYLELVKGRAYGESPHPDPLPPAGEGEESALKPSPSATSSKPSPFGRGLGEGMDKGQTSAIYTLYHCLNAILRLFAPFVPHVTEELYSHLFSDASIHSRGMWPKEEEYPVDEEIEISSNACIDVLESVRKMKSERNVSIKFPILRLKTEKRAEKFLMPFLSDLKMATNVEFIEFDDSIVLGEHIKYGMFNYHVTWAEQADVA